MRNWRQRVDNMMKTFSTMMCNGWRKIEHHIFLFICHNFSLVNSKMRNYLHFCQLMQEHFAPLLPLILHLSQSFCMPMAKQKSNKIERSHKKWRQQKKNVYLSVNAFSWVIPDEKNTFIFSSFHFLKTSSSDVDSEKGRTKSAWVPRN